MSAVASTMRAPDDPDACRRCGCSVGPIEADALGIHTVTYTAVRLAVVEDAS